jgi:hypothetical protein
VALLGGWLGPTFNVLNQQRAGRMKGQVEAEQVRYDRDQDLHEREQAQLRQDMQMKLWQAQLEDAQRPEVRNIDPLSEEGVAAAIRRKREEAGIEAQYATPEVRNIDPLSPDGIAAALRRKRGEAGIEQQYAKPKEPKEFDEQAYIAKRLEELTTPKQHFDSYAVDPSQKWAESPTMSREAAMAQINNEISRVKNRFTDVQGGSSSSGDGGSRISDYVKKRGGVRQ